MFNIIKKIQKWNLNRKQNKIKEEFESEGYGDDLLEKQVALNIKRNKFDIPDESKLNDDGYVQ